MPFTMQFSNSPERFCRWYDEVQDLIEGQNNNENWSAIHQLYLELLKDDAHHAYKNATALAQEDNENGVSEAIVTEVINSVKAIVFPIGAYPTQKRYLRRNISKPMKMPVREFVSRIQVVNRYFRFFPGRTPILPDDEVVEVILSGTPHKWQTELHRIGFRYETATTQYLRDKLERLEHCEHLSGEAPSQKRQGQQGQQESSGSHNGNAARTQRGSRGKRGRNNGQSNGDKVPCMLHGTTDHTTEECKVLKAQAKRMRASWDTNRPIGSSKKKNRRGLNNATKDYELLNSTTSNYVLKNVKYEFFGRNYSFN